MAFSQGSQSQLNYIEEATFGVTPAGDLTPLPFSTHTVSVTKDVVEGNDIRGDRQFYVERHGNNQVGGDITATFRDNDYDPLLYIETILFFICYSFC